MNADEKKILEYAITQFLDKGSYKTTMDELAKGLKISKKTIYKYFPSKIILMERVLSFLQEKTKRELYQIVDSEKCFLEKFVGVASYFAEFSIKMSKNKFIDFLKTELKLWYAVDNFRTHVIEHVWEVIIKQGKKEDFIINKNEKIILTMILSSLKGIINPTFLTENNITIKTAFDETFYILINGILTEKGKLAFEKLDWKLK